MSDPRYRTAKIYISLKHGETITKELHTQFKEGRNCDLEIRLNQKRLYVHKCLIDIFFIKAGAELEDDRFFLDLTRYSQPVVEALIGLVYTGNLRCTLDQVENVYKAAAELGCVEAQTGCQTYLRDHGVPVVIAPVNDSESSPSPTPQNPFLSQPESDPNIIVKTEPVDEFESSQSTSYIEPAKQTESGIGRNNYRSTFLVPVSSSNLGSNRPAYQYTMDSLSGDGKLQQNTLFNVTKAKPHPALPASQSYKYLLQSQTKTSRGKKRGRPPKVVVLEKNVVQKLKQMEPETHNFSATADEDSVDNIIKKTGKKANMTEHRTKSGTVFYKYADSSSVSQDEFSVDTDDGEGSIHDRNETHKSSGSDDEDNAKSEGQTVLEKWLANVSALVKTEKDTVDTSAASSSAEDNIEAQKNEQMFSLGLTKKTDKKTNEGEGNANNPAKRRLRTRKKVDYSGINIESGDFDDSSDYDPLHDVEPVPRKKYKSHVTTKGRNLKIDSANLVSVDSMGKANTKAIGAQNTKYVESETRPHSSTVAVRQDGMSNEYDDDSVSVERVYFPPAGSVPNGVNSQYAHGTFLKVKYVTETIKDVDGNVTVISKRVPVRPRQYGLDERLKNRPAVYVCHPTAPVVNPVVRKRRP